MKEISFILTETAEHPTSRRAIYYYENFNKIYDCDLYLAEKTDKYKYMPILEAVRTLSIRPFLKGVLPLYPDSKIVHIFKTDVSTASVSFICKFIKGKKIILDADDLDTSILTFRNPSFIIRKLLELYTPLYYNKVIVASDALRDMCLKKGVKKDKIVYMPIGVDVNRFKGITKLNLNRDKPIVMWIGWIWRPLEDLHHLFEAMKDVDAYCYLIGDGKARPYFEKLAKDMRIEDKIVFYGQVDFKAIPSLLKGADLLCLPMENNAFNRHRFPTKLCEYLISGTPVVVGNVGEVKYILDENHAFLVEDLKDLAKVINQALADPELAKQKAKNAQQLVLDKFDKTKQIDILLNIYRELLKA